jgi:hypothetical protein
VDEGTEGPGLTTKFLLLGDFLPKLVLDLSGLLTLVLEVTKAVAQVLKFPS